MLCCLLRGSVKGREGARLQPWSPLPCFSKIRRALTVGQWAVSGGRLKVLGGPQGLAI